MSPTNRGRRAARPYPEHYERTRVEGHEHPADQVIDRLPSMVRHRRKLAKLYGQLNGSTANHEALRAYVDARSMYQTERESLFYDAGFEQGMFAAQQDKLIKGMGNDPVAREVLSQIKQVIFSTELPRYRVVTLLLEAAWAMAHGLTLPQPSDSSPELAAIREVLWPGGNMDYQWSPDTIDEIARIARPPEKATKKGKSHG